MPPAHQLLSKAGRLPDPEANQQLLDEALAEQRAENRRQLQALLADPRRFAHTETGARLSLSPAEVEWLLQVLNDIRVGSWVRLGSPDDKARGHDRNGRAPFLGDGDGGVFSDAVAGGAGRGA